MELSNLSDAVNFIRTTSGPEARRRELRRKQRLEIDLIRSRNDCDRIGIPDHDQGHHYHEPFWFAVLDANGIWREVFEYITDPSDIASAYSTCDMFRHHLEKKRKMMILLPKVFRVLSERNYFRFIDYRTFDPDNEELPYGEFPIPRILNLRFVSKIWKQAMKDGLLAPADFFQPGWHLDYPSLARYTRYARGCPVVKFGTTEDVDRILNTFCPRNSPFARCIHITDYETSSRGDRDSFYDRVEHFLELHGKSAWALDIIQYIYRDDDFTFDYNNLYKMVRHMPNLKELEFYIFCQGESLRDGEEMRLRQKFHECPFPTIPSLKRLMCMFENFVHLPVFHEIVRANPNLKALSISRDRNPDIDPRLISTLGNLSSLECLEWIGPSVREPLNLKHVQPLREVKWPLLKTLVFSPSSIYNVLPRVSAADLFQFLSHFKTSLEKVIVDHGLWDILDDHDRSILIDFPHMQTIKIG